jgi:hypothetical protein
MIDNKLMRAVDLAAWLIEKQNTKPTAAYCIAKNKFGIENYAIIRKIYNARKKLRKVEEESRQVKLL